MPRKGQSWSELIADRKSRGLTTKGPGLKTASKKRMSRALARSEPKKRSVAVAEQKKRNRRPIDRSVSMNMMDVLHQVQALEKRIYAFETAKRYNKDGAAITEMYLRLTTSERKGVMAHIRALVASK